MDDFILRGAKVTIYHSDDSYMIGILSGVYQYNDPIPELRWASTPFIDVGNITNNGEAITVTIVDPIDVINENKQFSGTETGFTFLAARDDNNSTGVRKQIYVVNSSTYGIVVPQSQLMTVSDSIMALTRGSYFTVTTGTRAVEGEITNIAQYNISVNNQQNQVFEVTLTNRTDVLNNLIAGSASYRVEGELARYLRLNGGTSNFQAENVKAGSSNVSVTYVNGNAVIDAVSGGQGGGSSNFGANSIANTGILSRTVTNGSLTLGVALTGGDGIDVNDATISSETAKRTFNARNAYNDDSTAIPAWTFVVADEDFIITDGESVDYAGYKADVASSTELGAPGGITRIAIPGASGGNSGRAKDAVITNGVFDIVTSVNLGSLTRGSKLYLRETTANNRKSWTLQTTYQAGDLLVGRFLNSTGTQNEYTVEMNFDLARHAGNTDEIPEGATNKWYTDTKVDNRVLEGSTPENIVSRVTDNNTIVIDSNRFKVNAAALIDNAKITLDSSGKITANVQEFHSRDINFAFDREIFDGQYFSHDNSAKSISLTTANVVTDETVYTVAKNMFTGDVFVKDDTGRTITINLTGVVNESAVFQQVANIFQGSAISKYSGNTRIVIDQGSGGGGNVALGTFVARSTDVVRSEDGFLVYDGNNLARRTWEDVENQFNPAVTKEQGWINYRIRSENSGLVRGDIVLPTINANDNPNANKKVYIYPLAADEADIKAVLQRRFLLMAQDRTNPSTRYTQFVVTSAAPTVVSGVYAVDTQANLVRATGDEFENNDQVTFFSFSRSMHWDAIQPDANATTDARYSVYSVEATQDYVGYTGNLHIDAKLSEAAANANLAYDNIHRDLEILTDNTTNVQSNLTANLATVQGNLTSGLNTLTSNIDTVSGNVDAHTTVFGTVNSAIGAVSVTANANFANIAAIEANVHTGNASIVHSNLESYATTTNAALNAANTKIDNLGTAVNTEISVVSANSDATKSALDSYAATANTNINTVSANAATNKTALEALGTAVNSAIDTVSANGTSNLSEINDLFDELDVIQGNVNSTQSNVNTVQSNLTANLATVQGNVAIVQANLTANLANVSTNSHLSANSYPLVANVANVASDDRVIVTDNSAGTVLSLPFGDLNTIVTPTELLQATLDGYTYKTTIPGTGLAKGEVHVTDVGTQKAIYVNPLDKDRATLHLKLFIR